jgi:hypothetical protein
MQRNKIVLAATAIVTALVLYFGIQHVMTPKEPPFEEEMQKIAQGINKQCPMMIDQTTRLDNVMALPNTTFQYNYTLLNVEAGAADTESMKQYITPRIINNIKSNPDLAPQRQHKVTMSYLYKDKGGTSLFRVVVTPDMYQ